MMKSPFVWGKGGRAMTPEDVERERQLVAMARDVPDAAFMTDSGFLAVRYEEVS